jgi:predicted RNase H-like HicB family nuclease
MPTCAKIRASKPRGETIQEAMENFIDAFELFFRDELEGEIAKQSLDADRFEIEFALAQR